MSKFVVIVFFSLWIGAVIGQNLVDMPEPKVVEKPAKVKTVTKTETVVEREVYVPESCIEAMKQAEIISHAGGNFTVHASKQLTLLGDAKIEQFTTSDLSGLQEDQMELKTDMIGDATKLAKANTSYKAARDECNKEMK